MTAAPDPDDYAAAVRAVVDQSPPLTADQQHRLVVLLLRPRQRPRTPGARVDQADDKGAA